MVVLKLAVLIFGWCLFLLLSLLGIWLFAHFLIWVIRQCIKAIDFIAKKIKSRKP